MAGGCGSAGLSFAEAVAAAGVSIERALVPGFAALDAAEAQARLLGPEALRRNPAELVRQSRTKASRFDMLRHGVADALERGEALPPEVLDWLEGFLRGAERRPAARRGRKPAPWLNLVIWAAVRALTEAGLTATRRPGRPPLSACDAVAEAMAGLGREPRSYEAIRGIWHATARTVARID